MSLLNEAKGQIQYESLLTFIETWFNQKNADFCKVLFSPFLNWFLKEKKSQIILLDQKENKSTTHMFGIWQKEQNVNTQGTCLMW